MAGMRLLVGKHPVYVAADFRLQRGFDYLLIGDATFAASAKVWATFNASVVGETVRGCFS